MTGATSVESLPSPSTWELLRSRWLWLVLLAGTGVLGTLTLYFSWNVFDEGFTAKGGDIVLRGQLLFRDFLTLYGPAQFYLLAGLYWTFGVQLLVLRLWSILLVALFALVVYLVAARLSGDSRRRGLAALGASLLVLLHQVPSSGYSMVPAAALLIAAALPLQYFARTGEQRYLGAASLLIGLAALFRWEQGIFGLAALAGALAFWLWCSRPFTLKSSTGLAMWALGPALGLMAVVYLPLFAAAGLDNFIQDVLVHALRDFKAYRGIDFVRPQVWSILHAFEAGQPGQAIGRGIPLAGTVAVGIAVAGVLLRALWASRSRPAGGAMRPDAALTAAVFVALAVLGLLNQMRVRPDVSRSVLIIASAAPLFTYLWQVWMARTQAPLRVAAVSAWVLVLATAGAGAVSTTLETMQRRPLVRTESPHSRFMYNPVHSEGYNALIAYVRDHTQPGELIYSGVTDHQVLLLNDAMLYFLTGRDGPTRFYEMDPGLANTRDAQQHIAAALDKAGVRLLVLWDVQSTEDNLSSRPNGIDTLDRYIRAHYAQKTTFDNYQVWMRKGDAARARP